MLVQLPLSYPLHFTARQHDKLCMSTRCPPVCHALVLCQNDAIKDHDTFTDMSQDSSICEIRFKGFTTSVGFKMRERSPYLRNGARYRIKVATDH